MLKALGNILGNILGTVIVLALLGGVGYALWEGGHWAFDKFYYAGDRARAIELAKDKHAAELRQLVEAPDSKVTEVRGWEARDTDEPNVYLVLYKYATKRTGYARFFEVNLDLDLVREVKAGTDLGRKHDVLTEEERKKKEMREGAGDGTDLPKFLSLLRQGKTAKLAGGGSCRLREPIGTEGVQAQWDLIYVDSNGKKDLLPFRTKSAALKKAEALFHDG